MVLPSKDKAAFLLSYEELLQRRLGKYEHVVSVRPQQLVGRLTVEVTVLERPGIAELEVLGLQNSRQRGSGRGPGERCRQVCSGVPVLKPMAPLPSRPRVKQGSDPSAAPGNHQSNSVCEFDSLRPLMEVESCRAFLLVTGLFHLA